MHRAITLTQGDDLALAVAEHLHLDVARLFHKLFQEQTGVFEVGTGQTLHRRKGFGQLCIVAHQAHANAPATGGALEHDGVANAGGLVLGMLHIGQQATAGQQGHFAPLGQFTRSVFQAKGAHVGDGRADEGHARVLASLGKAGVFRQEPVARVNALRPTLLGNGQDGVLLEVAVCRQRGAHAIGLVGFAHMA